MDSSDLGILHDHYKESFSRILEREKQRDLLFLVLVAILGALFLAIQYPAHIQGLLKESTEIALDTLPIPVTTSATWTVFCVVMLRYCQLSLAIERQYAYLHRLEDAVSSLLGHTSVYSREGRTYLADYPMFSTWTWAFYALAFPVITIVLEAFLIYLEWDDQTPIEYNTWYDLTMAGGVFVSLLLYRGEQAWKWLARKSTGC